MERMVNKWLIWFLESNSFMADLQCSFWNRSGPLGSSCEFIRKEYVATLFFDLEKIYKTTCKYGIIWDLHNFKWKGRLFEFICNFFSNRKLQVCIRSILSNQKSQGGVSLESILSMTLFNIKINNITKYLKGF